MSNDDLRRGSDDEAHTRPSERPNADSPVNALEFPEFGELPGFAPLPDLAPLPELAPLPDLDDLLAATPSPLTDEAGAAQADTEPSQNPTSPGDATVRAQAPIAWSQTGDASTEDLWADTPLPMYGLMPDGASVEEAAFSSNDAASPIVATASSQAHPEGDETSTALHTPGPESSRTRVDTTAVTRKPSVVMIALAGVAALSVGIILLAPGLFGSSSVPSSKPSANATAATSTQVREHAENLPPREPGYRGSATNTHSMSPQWASGVATAWTLDLSLDMTQFGTQMFVDDRVLYIAGNDTIEGQRGSAVRILAYDLSGEEPTLLWDRIAPTKNSAITTYTPAFVSNENQLFFHDLIIDKATGEQTQAPWGIETPLAYADGILVTCTPPSTCNGWTGASGEWTNLWTTTTISQTSYGWAYQGLGYSPAGTTISGSGALASFLVPSNYQEAPQIINIHTGETTTLPSPDHAGLGQYVEVATDGFVVIDVSKKQGLLTDSAGAHQSTFSVDEYQRLPAVSRDGNNPSIADITTFMTTKTANWATGTVGLVGEDDCSIQVTLTSDGSTHTTPVPGVLSTYMTSSCYFDPGEVRVSADGSVLYADTFTYQDERRYFIDTANGLAYTSNLLNLPKQTTWVFDDMLIGMTDSGLTAFVPASS